MPAKLLKAFSILKKDVLTATVITSNMRTIGEINHVVVRNKRPPGDTTSV